MMTKKAFTLIEILITLVILGILGSLVAPSFFEYQRQKDLDLSIQLFETSLEEGFSSSRSVPHIFGVSAIARANEIQTFECEYPACGFKKTSSFFLLPNITVPEDFEILFLPPHGDIDNMSFSGENLILHIQNYRNESRSLRINKSSGLIERLWSQ